MRLYVAGPMTGKPQFNFPAFDLAAALLRDMGHDVVSPAELDDDIDRAAAMASPTGSALEYGTGVKKTWGQFLARDVRLLSDDGIEGVVVLHGWQNSRGARLETFVARLNGLPVYQYSEFEDALVPVPDIMLYRAWCQEPLLSIAHTFEKVPA